MPKDYDELSDEAKANALYNLRHDEGYSALAGGWEIECAVDGIIDFLKALGFDDVVWREGITGTYYYRKAAEVKKALDDCPYASKEIYELSKKLIEVQRKHRFELYAEMKHGNVQNVFRTSAYTRYADVPELDDVLDALDNECRSIIRRSREYIFDKEYMEDELRANVPGGFDDDGEEADPYGIYHANGQRVGEMNENINPIHRRFNRVG